MLLEAPIVFVLVAIGAFLQLTSGYGYLSFPPATYRDLKRSQIYTKTFNSSIHPMFFGLRQLDASNGVRLDVRAMLLVNQLTFADYMSLREIADVIYPTCGNSVVDQGIDPVNVHNARYLLWRNEDEKFGFYPKTQGPCETWIDNERVQFHGNCVRAYSTYPAKVPVDFSRCRPGRVCELRFYWIAMDTTPLKLMKHCVRVVNDPNRPAAKENTEPYKNLTSPDNATSFSVDLMVTWEKIWLEDDGTLGHSDREHSGATILVIQ